MVQELLPASVAFVGQMDVDDRVVFGFYRFPDEFHPCLCGGTPTFFDIAFQTCADDIAPCGSTTDSAGDDMVQRQFSRGKPFAAILAMVAVPGEQVVAVEFDPLVRDAVISQQPNHTRHGNMKINCGYPVVLVGLKSAFGFAQLDPTV